MTLFEPRARLAGTFRAVSLTLGLVLISSLGLAGCGGSVADETGADEVPAERSVPVSTVEVVARPVADIAELPADLRPRRRATLAAEVAGVVEVMRVEDGDLVEAGQLLLEVDTRGLRQRLAEAEAIDRQRQAQFERAQALLERRSITKAQMLDALTAKDVAAAQLESARLELERSRLTAPWAGQVAAAFCEVGDYVQVGEPAIELVDASGLEVTATAPAADVPFLRVGLDTEVRVDIFPGQVFGGRISRLGAELDAATRTLEVVVELANPGGLLRPGLSARVRVPRRQLAAALLVPLQAVVELEDTRAVYVATGGRAEQRVVELGPVIGADRVVIEAGLEAGDHLIIEGQRRVSPGQKIEAQRIGADSIEAQSLGTGTPTVEASGAPAAGS